MQVASGFSFASALHADGTISCRGFGFFGALGDGTLSDADGPVPVVGIDSAVEITAGDNHMCALLEDATVRCWGSYFAGELGAGDDVPSSALPVDPRLEDVARSTRARA